MEVGKPCKKCGSKERGGRGDCAECNRRAARLWRKSHPYRERHPTNNACVKCGGTERYGNGDCKQCTKKRSTENLRKLLASPQGEQVLRHRTHKARLTKYRITQEELEERMQRQSGLCAICRSAPATHIDHDHKTGRVRGMLCLQCNTALGGFRDSVENLVAAMGYLWRWK